MNKKNLNVQTWIDIRDLAALVRTKSIQGGTYPRQISPFLRQVLQESATTGLSFQSAEEALEFLLAQGFQIAQFSTALIRELSHTQEEESDALRDQRTREAQARAHEILQSLEEGEALPEDNEENT